MSSALIRYHDNAATYVLAPSATFIRDGYSAREAWLPPPLSTPALFRRCRTAPSEETQDGTVLSTVNPKNQVPVLELDNGQRLTEGPAIVQYLADQKPGWGLVPPPGTMERYRVQEWLNFITSELHKTFGPMFRPAMPEEFKKISREYLAQRFDWIDKQLAGNQCLMGDTFTVADAYMFTVLRWSPRVGIDLSKWSNIEAYLDRVAARPKVREAMKAEGLLQ